MKSPIIVGGVMLAIGIAIGWVAKSSPNAEKTAVAAVSSGKPATPAPPAASPPASAESPTPGKRAIRPTEPAKPAPGMPTPDQMDQAKEMQSQMAKKMVDRQRQKFETQIARLTKDISLTDDQKSKLNAWLDERLKVIGESDLMDPTSAAKMMEDFKLLNDETLQAQLDGTLTPEQQTALTDYQEREHLGKVDALALKSLSKLQGIIQFEEGQRDQVYKLLSQSAEESLTTQSETPDISSMFTEGMGIEMDPYDLGIQQAMTEAMGDPSQLKDGSKQIDLAKSMRQIIADRIDSKVEALRPVLNDSQLDAYRNELQTKGLGIYGTVLDSMEKAADGKNNDDSTIVLPIH